MVGSALLLEGPGDIEEGVANVAVGHVDAAADARREYGSPN